MSASREKVETLLVAEATEGLAPGEAGELEALLAEHPDIDRYGFERAAAAVFLAAAVPSVAAMPGDLYQQIITSGQSWFEEPE